MKSKIEKKLDIYKYNWLKALDLDLNAEKSKLLSRLIGLEQKILKNESANLSLAEDILAILREPAFGLKVCRVCVAVATPFSHRLHVLSSANSKELGSNNMASGYSCFIAQDSSLFQFSGSDTRICSDMGKAMQSYTLEGRPPQRSLARLFGMGVRSGLTIGCELGNLGIGYLFLNSDQSGHFDKLQDHQYLFLCVLKLLLKSCLFGHFNAVISLGGPFNRNIDQSSWVTDIYDAEEIVTELRNKLEKDLDVQVDLQLNTNFRQKIFFPLNSFLFLQSEIFSKRYSKSESNSVVIHMSMSSDRTKLVISTELERRPNAPMDSGIEKVGHIFGCAVSCQDRQFTLTYTLDATDPEQSKTGYST